MHRSSGSYVVIRESSPVAEERVELDDGLLLLERELAPLDVRPQVVGPPEPAALAAPLQPCSPARSVVTHPGQSHARRAPGPATAAWGHVPAFLGMRRQLRVPYCVM